ncbi:glycosyltransferase family 4 protein [Paenibacillus doosanensis]|uniref:glycosyltransferase family 4 protein n=1 Tax=Paenibacillus doosanensis TaxID=1229154 RepID=UPI00217FDBEB|nr:glycosyltransferase family 4 protein [Paenibacillus doosanensis]MCS7459581.1 glycosyltransferase family 4 protein [Paenibacillus doosanensis]
MGKVSIFTHSFLDGYNRDLSRIFGGGLERYIYDLCGVIRDMGYQPQVHQLSFFEAFHRTVEHIEVFGYPYDPDRIDEAFNRMAEQAEGPLLYASCIWHPIRYRPGSLGICHGINWDRPSLPEEVKRSVADQIGNAVRSLSKIVTVDSHFQTYCRSVCTYNDPERIELIPNAVDTGYFCPEAVQSGDTPQPESAPVNEPDAAGAERGLAAETAQRTEAAPDSQPLRILYPRRLSMERGIIAMMLAADELLAQYPQIEIEFAGEQVEGSTISEAFSIWHSAHPHRDRIVHRTYSFEEIRRAYRQADIAVIPTLYSEGTSYSCLEAMSCGLPIVAANVGGLNDLIIDGYNGLLVPPTVERLCSALRRLLNDRALRQRLGGSARQVALAFDKKEWRRKWRAVLEAYLPPASAAPEPLPAERKRRERSLGEEDRSDFAG